MQNSEVMSKELAGDSLNEEFGSIEKENGNIKNNIRGCKCAPKYKAAQRWKDGRIRLSEMCGIHPNIMLDPNGTYRVQVDEDLSYLPEEEREKIRQDIKNIKEKNARAGCELLWDGKIYTFHGYY